MFSRRCGIYDFKPWPNDNTTYPVRTYRVALSASTLGFPTAFDNPDFDDRGRGDDPGDGQIGFLPSSYQYDKGAVPEFIDQDLPIFGPCGPADAWIANNTDQTNAPPLNWYDVGASGCCLGITTADTHMGLVFTSINTPEVAVPPKLLGIILGNKQAPPVVSQPTKIGILLGAKQIPRVILPVKKNGLIFGNVPRVMVKPAVKLTGFFMRLYTPKTKINITTPQRSGLYMGLPGLAPTIQYPSNTGRVRVYGNSYQFASYMVTSAATLYVSGMSSQQAIVTYSSQAVVQVNGSSNIISALGYNSQGGLLVGGSSSFVDTCTYSSSGRVKVTGSSNIISPVAYASTATVYVAGSSATTSANTYASTATIYVNGSSAQQAIVTYNSQAVVQVFGSSDIISPVGYASVGGLLVGGSSAFIDTCSYSSQGSVKVFGSSNIPSPVGYVSTATVYVAGLSSTTSAITYASTATIYVNGSSSRSAQVTYNSNTGTIYVSGSSSKASITSQLVQTVFGHSNSADSISITWNKPTTAGNLLVVVVAAATADVGAPSGSWAVVGATGSGCDSAGMFYLANAASQSTTSFSYAGGSAGGLVWIAAEFSGVVTSSPLDKGVGHSGSSNPVTSASSGTLSQADELVLVSAYMAKDSRSFTAPSTGFTFISEMTTSGATNPASVLLMYETVSATTAQTGSCTDSTSGDAYGSLITTFKNT